MRALFRAAVFLRAPRVVGRVPCARVAFDRAPVERDPARFALVLGFGRADLVRAVWAGRFVFVAVLRAFAARRGRAGD